MLRIIRIEPIEPGKYLVSFDRDGKVLRYVFYGSAPEQEDDIIAIRCPADAMRDLADYEYQPRPGEPYGAFYVPVVHETAKLVQRIAEGAQVELPIVLDER